MAITDSDTLSGSLELTGRPRSIRWSTPLEFTKFLIESLRVKFPVNPGNRFIVKGPATPTADDQDSIWAKTDKGGNPLGWWIFTKGQWRLFYTAAPGEVRWIYGDSLSPPAGWQTITEAVSGLDAAFVAKLKTQYVANPAVAGAYIYFAVRYIGY